MDVSEERLKLSDVYNEALHTGEQMLELEGVVAAGNWEYRLGGGIDEP